MLLSILRYYKKKIFCLHEVEEQINVNSQMFYFYMNYISKRDVNKNALDLRRIFLAVVTATKTFFYNAGTLKKL